MVECYECPSSLQHLFEFLEIKAVKSIVHQWKNVLKIKEKLGQREKEGKGVNIWKWKMTDA